jgi:hypothetical protein
VKSRPEIEDVLGDHVPRDRKIDFVNIDVEGFEDEVLASNDWERYRPSLIAAEVCGRSVADILSTTTSTKLLEQD